MSALVGDVRIRAAKPTDAALIHELHLASVRQLCASSYSSALIDAWLAGRSPDGYRPGIDRGQTFVAESDLDVVGFCEAAAGEIRAVFVHPRWAGRGIGAMLLSQALRVARVDRAAVRLESTLNAVAFYEHYGLREVARGSARRNGVDVPIVVMEISAG